MKTKKIFFIGYVWPEPATTAAGHRMLQLIIAFKKNNYAITFASTAAQTPYTTNLQDLGVRIEHIKLNHSSFDTFIKDLQPDMVVFDRFMIEEQFGWRVAEFAPNAIRVLNTEDLHSLRQTREACYKKQESFSITKWKQNENTKREIASIYRSDLTLLISSVETDLLKSTFNITPTLLHTLPFLIDEISSKNRQELPSFENRKDFIFIGNGKHAPNVDAIKFLKKEIWPLIRQELPEAQLQVYGAYLPQQVNEMHKPSEGFIVKGWLEDLDATMQHAKVNLAPLRFGAGLKGKVIDAMRSGTPTITTKIGAEGILGFENFYNDSSEFAEQAITMYTSRDTWLESQKKNFSILQNHFSKETLATMFFDKINSLMTNLETHRENNFIGELLRHQTLSSTKFMSKWIEEKHKHFS